MRRLRNSPVNQIKFLGPTHTYQRTKFLPNQKKKKKKKKRYNTRCLPTWSNLICCSSEQEEDGRSEAVGIQSGNKSSNKTAKFFYCGKGSTMRALTISLGTRAFTNEYSNQSLSEHNFITLCNVSVLDTLYKTDNSRKLSYNVIA